MDHLMNSNDDVTIKNNTTTIMCPVTPAPVIILSLLPWNHNVMILFLVITMIKCMP